VFIIAGAAVSPTGEIDYLVAIDNAADAQLAANELSFAEKFVAFNDGLTQAVNDISSAVNMVRSTLYSIQSGIVSTISKVQTALTTIYNTISDVVNFPSQLAAAITSTLETYRTLFDDASNNTVVNATLNLTTYGELPNSSIASKYGGTLEEIPSTGTYNSDQKIANRNAIIHAVRVGAILEASRVAMRINYTSYNQAFAMMQKIVSAIDDVLLYIGTSNDQLYSDLQAFKPLIVSGLLTKGASLPLVIDYQVPTDVTPSLVIAHDLYEDLDREQEVIDRNSVAMIHPGFPPSGDTLEVRNE
jgi:prophage DNA circulation protein